MIATDVEDFEDTIGLEAYVVDQLAGGVTADKIIFAVAQRQQWRWSRAEDFVNLIATQQSETILDRQKPLLRVMSVLLLVTGFVIVFVTLSTIMVYVNHLMSQRMSDVEFLATFMGALGAVIGRDFMQLMLGLSLLIAGAVGWIKTLPPRIPPALDYGVDEDDVQ